MRKLKTLYILLFNLIIFNAGCGDQEIKEEDLTSFNQLEWLIGIWEGKQGDADIYESWRRKNFRIMEGISYTTQDKRRVYAQTMRIEQNNNKIVLILKYNEGEESILDLVNVKDGKAGFENREDKYPHTVTYELSGKKLNVLIEGKEGESATELNYRKTAEA